MTPEERVKKLEELLGNLIADGLWLNGEVGVHPAAWTDPNHPDDNYTERTPEQEAHNQMVFATLKRLIEADKFLKGDKWQGSN